MKAGKVGILVIMISLAGMLGIGWFMSMDVVMTEKTVYNELTDITPLFGSEQAPEFTDYTPSTNYTGYYTDNSIVNNVKYFDGVDYSVSARANVYAVYDLNSIEQNSAITLSDYTGTNAFNLSTAIFYWFIDANDGIAHSDENRTSTTVTLDSYITALNLDPSVNLITITSIADPDPSEVEWGQVTDVDWILFSVPNYWKNLGGTYAIRYATTEWFQEKNVNYGYVDNNNNMYLPAIVACKVELGQQLVYFYLDKDCTEQYGIYNLSDVIMSYGGSGTNTYSINFGDTANLFAASVSKNYMDPTKGVEMI